MIDKTILLIILTLTSGQLMGHTIQFTNAQISNNSNTSELWIEDGVICSPQERADEVVDLKQLILAPGFIDIQINGGFGIDITSEPDRVDELAQRLPEFGVTSFLPTVITSSTDVYKSALPNLQPRKVKGGAEILGIHLEGPFINKEKRGAHPVNMIREPTTSNDEVMATYGPVEGVKIVTLAPELPNAHLLIETLHSKGIICSMGHSMATWEEANLGAAAGCSLVTHLFCAMTSIHHREPGLAIAALQNPNLYYSVIPDGVHLHRSALHLAWKADPNGMIIISDGMAAMGLPAGNYQLGESSVVVDGTSARVAKEGQLAGSIGSVDHGIRNVVDATGCTLGEAIACATEHPARLLKIERRKGSLDIGADADLVVLNQQGHVQATYIGGKLVWHN